MSGSSDILYIQKLQQGDKQALYTLYDRYSGAIFGVVIRICRDEQQAQDILQEVFLKIWKKIGSYDPEKGKFYTWASRIARNTTLNALRKKDAFIQTDDFSVYESATQPESKENFEALNGAITTLSAHHRRAIQLVYFQGYTHREAHKVMQVPLGTFKSYIRQAVIALREVYVLKE